MIKNRGTSEGRINPPELGGSLYPNGIPVADESELEALMDKHGVDEEAFSYSDVPYSGESVLSKSHQHA